MTLPSCARTLIATGIAPVLCATASAQLIFSADFDDFSGGNFNGGQFESGIDLAFGGNLPAWSKSGGGAVHVMDHANQAGNVVNPRDIAVMIWQDNVITLLDPIPSSNSAGVDYLVEFEASPAVYQAGSQQTSETDGLLIELLRPDNSVLADYIHLPGAWTSPPVLAPDSFVYTGDGSGDLKLRIGPSAFGSGRFGGAIDNVMVSISNPLAPKIVSFAASPNPLPDAGEAVTLEWNVEMPLESLVLNPGEIDLLPATDGEGMGSLVLDPGPDGTTEYTLTATRDGESLSRSLTVTLPAPVIHAFTPSPAPLSAGQPLTLSWDVELPVTTLTIDPGGIDVLGETDDTGAGSISFDPGPAESTTFALTATRGTSASTRDAVARVITPPNPNAVFFTDFDDLDGGTFNGAQFESGLDLAFGGNLPAWSKSGGGAVHVADLANQTGNVVNPRDFAVMIWQDNVITQLEPVPGSNQAGLPYLVQFEAAPAVYQAGSQQTGPDDGLLIELLRDDDSVLADFVHLPGPWDGFPGMVPVSFEYTGDGSGDLRFRVGPSSFGSGRFGGMIDNLTLAPSILPRLRITAFSRDAASGDLRLSWESSDGKLYNLRSEVDPSAAEPPDWPIFGELSDLEATPPENTLTIPLPPESGRFFVVEEFNAPPQSILADDFENGQGDWTIGSDGADGTAWEVGPPSAVGPIAAHSPANCFGTNLSGDYAPDANVWLRSPAIDLTTAGGATVSYSQYFDIEAGFDLGRVSLLDSTDDSVLVVLEEALDGTSPDWQQVTRTLPPEALGRIIRIEFRFISDDLEGFAGWYLDDFNLTVP